MKTKREKERERKREREREKKRDMVLERERGRERLGNREKGCGLEKNCWMNVSNILQAKTKAKRKVEVEIVKRREGLRKKNKRDSVVKAARLVLNRGTKRKGERG